MLYYLCTYNYEVVELDVFRNSFKEYALLLDYFLAFLVDLLTVTILQNACSIE